MTQVKAVYSINDLCKLSGMSRKKIIRMLENLGVPISRVGVKRIVYLSHLKEHMPDLWDSLVEQHAICGDIERFR